MDRNVNTKSRLLFLGLGVLSVALVLYAFSDRWRALQEVDLQVQPVWFVPAVLCVTLAVAGFGLVWREVLARLEGRPLSFSLPLMRAFFYPWLARYVPGTVPFLLFRIEMTRKLGHSRSVGATSLMYENVLQLGTALLLSMLLLFIGMARHADQFWFYGLALVPLLACAACAQPGIFVPSVNWLCRRLGRNEIDSSMALPPRAMLRICAMYGVFVAINGLGFYFTLRALTPVGLDYLPAAIGIYNLAGVLGIMLVIFPSGLGVREGIITGLVALQFPLEVAIASAVLARLVAITADALPAGVLFAFDATSRFRCQLRGPTLRGRRILRPLGNDNVSDAAIPGSEDPL